MRSPAHPGARSRCLAWPDGVLDADAGQPHHAGMLDRHVAAFPAPDGGTRYAEVLGQLPLGEAELFALALEVSAGHG